MKQVLLAITLTFSTLLCIASPDGKIKGGKQTYVPQPDVMVPNIEPQAAAASDVEPRQTDIRKRTLVMGIDVSHYQGHINWRATASDHQVNYCYIKATQSTSYVDDRYAYNIREGRRAGVKVGAYHFFSHSTPPMEQLRNMTSVVKLEEQDLIPMIDVETIGRRTDVVGFIRRLKTFLHGFEQHYGMKPIIYTGQNFFNRYLAGHFPGYKFMIAKYHDDEPVIHDNNVQMLMWQFSCEGTIQGINGPCDQSMFLNDYKLNDILIIR